MTSELHLDELSAALERILSDLRKRGVEIISIEEEGYLHVSMDKALDVYGDPVLSLGRYDEDMDLIRKEPQELEIVSYNYIQSLSSLIQYLGIRPPRRS